MTYDFGLLSIEHASSVVGEDNLLVDHGCEINTRLPGALRVCRDEVVDLGSINASHALDPTRRIIIKAFAANVLCDEGEVRLRCVLGRDVRKDSARVQRDASCNGVIRVGEAIVINTD